MEMRLPFGWRRCGKSAGRLGKADAMMKGREVIAAVCVLPARRLHAVGAASALSRIPSQQTFAPSLQGLTVTVLEDESTSPRASVTSSRRWTSPSTSKSAV